MVLSADLLYSINALFGGSSKPIDPGCVIVSEALFGYNSFDRRHSENPSGCVEHSGLLRCIRDRLRLQWATSGLYFRPNEPYARSKTLTTSTWYVCGKRSIGVAYESL